MEAWIATQLPALLKSNKIELKDSTLVSQLAFYIYNMIYNVSAIVATNASIYDPNSRIVKPRHLQESLKYIQKKCYPSTTKQQKGGNIDAEFHGKDSGRYTAQPGENELVLDFTNKIARPEISGGSDAEYMEISYILITNSKKKELFPTNELKQLIATFKMDITNHSLKLLQKVLRMHLNCLMLDLYENSPITLDKLERIINLKRHAVFL